MGRYRATLNFSADGSGRIAQGVTYEITDEALPLWQADIDAGWMVPVDDTAGDAAVIDAPTGELEVVDEDTTPELVTGTVDAVLDDAAIAETPAAEPAPE